MVIYSGRGLAFSSLTMACPSAILALLCPFAFCAPRDWSYLIQSLSLVLPRFLLLDFSGGMFSLSDLAAKLFSPLCYGMHDFVTNDTQIQEHSVANSQCVYMRLEKKIY